MNARKRRSAVASVAILAGLAVPATAAGDEPDCSLSAQADLEMAPQVARAGGLQRLSAEDSHPQAPCAATFAWDLDDDGEFDDASGRVAEARFPAGRSRVSVRVVDAAGRASVARRSFPVNTHNIEPAVDPLVNPYAPVGGQALRLSAGDHDIDGVVGHVEWNLDADNDVEHRQSSTDRWSGVFPGFDWTFPAGPVRIAVRGYDDGDERGVSADEFTLPADSSENDGPQVHSLAVAALIRAGDPITFEGYFTDPDTGPGLLPPEATTWDLDGDGAFDDGTGRTVTRAFPAGDVTIRVRTVDAEGAERVLSFGREVVGFPLAPAVRTLDVPAEVDVGETASLVAQAGALGNIGVVDLAWDLDADGEFDDAAGPNASVAFAGAGAREVSLRATDPEGAFLVETRTIRVGAQPPPDDDDDGDDDGPGPGGDGGGDDTGSGGGTNRDDGTGGSASSTDPAAAGPPAVRPGMALRMRAGRQRLEDVRRRGLRVRLFARHGGTLRLAVRIEAGLARRLGIRRRIGSLVVVLQGGAERIVRVELDRSARRALRRAKPRRAAVSVTARRID